MDKSPDAVIIATEITYPIYLILSQNAMKIKKPPPILAFTLKQVGVNPILVSIGRVFPSNVCYTNPSNGRQLFSADFWKVFSG